MAGKGAILGCGEKQELAAMIPCYIVVAFRLKWGDAKTGAQSGLHELNGGLSQ